LDTATGRTLRTIQLVDPAFRVAFSPDGRYLASCSGYKGKGTIQIWEARIWDKQSAQARRPGAGPFQGP
jgi:hypothetical protein